MRALVIGGGAIGQFLAAKLRQGGNEPVIFARPAGAEALNVRGVTLRTGAASTTVPVRATADASDPILAEPFELAIVAVKAYSTPEAIDTLRKIPACGQASILTVQNGLGNEEELEEAFGRDRIVAGALTVAVDRVDETSIAATRRGGLSLAPVGATPHNWMLLVWERTGLAVRAASDWRALKWSKLCINILGNGVCAALDWTPAEVYKDPVAFSVERACLLETISVMDRLRLIPVNLIGFPVGLLILAARSMPAGLLRAVMANRVARGRGAKLPSLLLDLRAGRHVTEVGALNGAVALNAVRNGCQAPSNSKISSVVSGIAAGQIPWSDYRGSPAKLVSAS